MSFPVLRLPLLPLATVIKHIPFKKLFTLSLCSKRMHYIVKNFRDKSINLDLRLIGHSYICLTIEDTKHFVNSMEFRIRQLPSSNIPRTWNSVKIGGILLMFQENRNGFNIYCRDVRYGTKQLVAYICELLNKQLDGVHIQKSHTWTVELIHQLQDSVDKASIHDSFGQTHEVFSNMELANVLLKLNTKLMDMRYIPTDDFRIENYNKAYDHLVIHHGKWVTVDNLLTLDCIELHIGECKLTSRDVNQLLKHWIAGGAPRLKVFCALIEENIEEDLHADIGHHLKTIPGTQEYTSLNDKYVFDGQLVVREDSAMASVQYFPEKKRIRFAVWPDGQGYQFSL